MPIDPPSIVPAARLEPTYLTEDDLLDLATFTGLSREACLKRVQSYSFTELADAWAQANPQTSEEILAFYRSTQLYVWELMQWHASSARRPYWDALAYVVEHYRPDKGWRRVYDFGCGIGTDALFLATRGYDVTLVDVDGPTLQFARHRFERRGINARFVESTLPLPDPDGQYDVMVCFDVFEHLPDPLASATRMVKALRKNGLLVQQGAFGDDGYHPCHLQKGIARYQGLRWHIHLAALGLRLITGLVYRKGSGLEQVVQRARYRFWRATRLWVSLPCVPGVVASSWAGLELMRSCLRATIT